MFVYQRVYPIWADGCTSLNLDHPFNSILVFFVVLDPLPDYYFWGALEILTGA